MDYQTQKKNQICVIEISVSKQTLSSALQYNVDMDI